jgi:predicted protein tyrosine phosphatase
MITVSPFHAVPGLVDRGGISHVVSLLGPGTPHVTLQRLRHGCHLKLSFDDVCEPHDGCTVPCREHVEEIIGFAGSWDRSGGMLIHCWAGVSRSTAAAYATMCALHPDEDEAELAWELRRISPTATPNRLMVAFADDILGRRGRMRAAVEAIGRGVDAYEGIIFSWPLPNYCGVGSPAR